MTVLIVLVLLSAVACDRAGHAVAAAAAAAELLSRNGVDLDPGGRQPLVGHFVSLVRDDDARRERDEVVAVVPLVALGLELVSSGGDDRESLEAERFGDLVDEWTFRERDAEPTVASRGIKDGQDLRYDRFVDRHEVPIAESEDGVEMHRRSFARHQRTDDE